MPTFGCIPVIALVTLVVCGCQGPTSSRSTGEEVSEPAPRSPSASTSTDINDAGLVDNIWAWSVVTEAPQSYDGDLEANDGYVAAPAGGATGIYRRIGDRRSLLLTPVADAGFRIDKVALGEHWATWVEVEDVPTNRPHVRVHVADLRTGATVRLDEVPGVPDPGLPPTVHQSGGHLVYTTQDGQDTNCIAQLDLSTFTGRVVYCTERKEFGVGFPSFSSAGVVFNEWRPSPKPSGCRRVLVAGTGDKGVEPVPARSGCRPFSGLAGDGFWFWGEQRPHTPGVAEFFAAIDDGDVVSLGEGDTAKEAVCGGWVYWVSFQGEAAELRRWRPDAQVEVVYRNDDRWLAVSTPRCQGQRITIGRFPDGGGRQQLVEALLPLDG